MKMAELEGEGEPGAVEAPAEPELGEEGAEPGATCESSSEEEFAGGEGRPPPKVEWLEYEDKSDDLDWPKLRHKVYSHTQYHESGLILDFRPPLISNQSYLRFSEHFLHESSLESVSDLELREWLEEMIPSRMTPLHLTIVVVSKSQSELRMDSCSSSLIVERVIKQLLIAELLTERTEICALPSDTLARFEQEFPFLFVGLIYEEREQKRINDYLAVRYPHISEDQDQNALVDRHTHYAKYPSLIIDDPNLRLFLGNLKMASDSVILTDLRVSHVINATPSVPFCEPESRIATLRVPLKDIQMADLFAHFEECVRFVEQSISDFEIKSALPTDDDDGGADHHSLRTTIESDMDCKSSTKSTTSETTSDTVSMKKEKKDKKKSRMSLGISSMFSGISGKSSKKKKRDLMLDRRKKDKPVVLVHCVAGVSRSGAIVIALLMSLRKWDRGTATDWVQKHRPKVRPNPGFVDQLSNWEAFLKA